MQFPFHLETDSEFFEAITDCWKFILFLSPVSCFPAPAAVLLFWPRVLVPADASRLEASFSLLHALERRISVRSCCCRHCCYSLDRFHLRRMLNDRGIGLVSGSAVCPDSCFSCKDINHNSANSNLVCIVLLGVQVRKSRLESGRHQIVLCTTGPATNNCDYG